MGRPQSLVQMGTDQSLATTNMLIYGPPGIGKTPFWGSGNEQVLIMDSDDGSESAEFTGSKASRVRCHDYTDLDEIYNFLKHDKHDFKWAVWDSLTLFQDRVLVDDIMLAASDANPRQDRYVASQREYLVSYNRMGEYVRLFVGLPMNFGITTHVMFSENQQAEDGSIIHVPSIAGKGQSSKISGYMNVIGFLGFRPNPDGGERKRAMLFRQTESHLARDRFSALPSVMNDPTLPKIDQFIEAKRATLKVTGSAAGPVTKAAKKAVIIRKAASTNK